MAHQIEFEDTKTIVCVIEADNGSTYVDVDDLALVLRKRGREWLERADLMGGERKFLVHFLDRFVDETVSTIKRHALTN